MKFLNLDSPLMKFLSKMTDVLWLNILTLLCVILIIPAGAGFTALHYVCLKMVRDEDGYITKDFIKSFKKNFGQATIIWLIILAVTTVIIIDLKCLSYVSNPTIIFGAIMAASLFFLFTVVYVFPILSHFENTVKGTIKNAFFMSILALPRTFGMILLTITPLALIIIVIYFETFLSIVPLSVLFFFSAPAYFCAKLYNKTFKRFEPETAAEKNDDFSWTVTVDEEDEKATSVEVSDTPELETKGDIEENGEN